MSGQPGASAVTVLMTVPGAETAEEIIRHLLDEKLIACGTVLPGAVSVYRWEGKIQRDEEAIVILKTVPRLVSRVLERAGELHPYEVPELLVHEVADGAPAYLAWVEMACRGRPIESHA